MSNTSSYVTFSDFLVLTALDNYLSETAELLGEQAGSSIDLVVRNIITAAPNVRYAGGAGSRGAVTASSILSASELRRALRTLKRSNARPFDELNGNYAFTLHPDGMYDLLGDSTIVTAFQRGAPRGFDDQPELIGYIGQYMNFSLFETTNARIFPSQGATGADVYCALAIGKDAYGVTEIDQDGLQTYFQPLGSSGAVSDPLHQLGSIGNETPADVKLRVIKGKAYGRKPTVTHKKLVVSRHLALVETESRGPSPMVSDSPNTGRKTVRGAEMTLPQVPTCRNKRVEGQLYGRGVKQCLAA